MRCLLIVSDRLCIYLFMLLVLGNVFKTGPANEPEKLLGGWVTGSTVGSNRSNRDDVIIMS